MKPKHYKPQYAIQQSVADLLGKFVYPDEDTPAPGLFVGGGGGAPTIVIAAVDASDFSKNKADFICTGVNDDETITAALRLLPFRGGRILLTEGHFQCRYGQIVADTATGRFVTIQGMGRVSTFINFSGTTGTGIAYNNAQGEIKDLGITDDGGATAAVGISAAASVELLLDNILFLNSGTGVLLNLTTSTARRARIRSCSFQNGSIGISLTGSAHSHVMIHNNQFMNTGSHAISSTATGNNQGLLIQNNVINIFLGGGGIDAINIGGAYVQISVIGNTILNNQARGVVLNSTPNGCEIANNVIVTEGSGIEIVSGSDSIIADNRVDSNEHCILINNCERLAIEGNHVKNVGGFNTFDGIHLSGDSDENYLTGNVSVPSTSVGTRYGINISAATCQCNIVVGNSLGDPALYGTDALNDAGTDTQLFWPNDATYGDNFTACIGSGGGGGVTVLTDDWVGSNGDPWNPAKWTTSIVNSGVIDIQSNEGRQRGAANNSHARAIGIHTALGDSEVLFKVRASVTTATQFVTTLRGDGTWSAVNGEQERPLNGYTLTRVLPTGIGILARMNAGTRTQLGNDFPWTADTLDWWIRFRVENVGGDIWLRARIWHDGDIEPGTWNAERQDVTAAFATGQLQISHKRADTGASESLLDDLVLTSL